MNKDSEENDKNSNLGNEISCGELLARTRQEKDLNTEEIAKELRINVSIIEMMEGNEFQSIGAPVFVKGYLRQYANILGLSADSILEEYSHGFFISLQTLSMNSFYKNWKWLVNYHLNVNFHSADRT